MSQFHVGQFAMTKGPNRTWSEPTKVLVFEVDGNTIGVVSVEDGLAGRLGRFKPDELQPVGAGTEANLANRVREIAAEYDDLLRGDNPLHSALDSVAEELDHLAKQVLIADPDEILDCADRLGTVKEERA